MLVARAVRMASRVESIRFAEGDTKAGRVRKSRVKPRAVKRRVGSRMHFFQFIMKPACVRQSIRMSRILMAEIKEGEAPKQSST